MEGQVEAAGHDRDPAPIPTVHEQPGTAGALPATPAPFSQPRGRPRRMPGPPSGPAMPQPVNGFGPTARCELACTTLPSLLTWCYHVHACCLAAQGLHPLCVWRTRHALSSPTPLHGCLLMPNLFPQL